MPEDRNDPHFTYSYSWHKVSMYGRWWNLLTRFRWWRWKRRSERDRKKLSPEARAAYDDMHRQMDHLFFFGEDRP